VSGNSDYINVGTSPLQEASATAMTFSTWVNVGPTDFDGTVKLITDSASGSSNHNDGFLVVVEDRNGGTTSAGINTFKAEVATATNDWLNFRAPDNTIGSSTWYYVVVAYDSTNGAKMYIDGVSQTLSTVNDGTGNYVPRNANLYIGALNDGTVNLDGTIDEVRVSDTARSADWIEACYRNQSGNYVKPWRNGDWPYRQAIVIDSSITTADLTDFPYMVKITDGANDVFASAQSNGNDILFTTADGSTKLPHEIEDFTTTSGSEQLIAWVKIPTLSANEDTTIFMYYGHSTIASQQDVENVWDANYVMVQHLQESDIDGGAGDILDSTSNNNDGTTSGMDTDDQVTGKIGGSFDFDGSDDYVDVGSAVGDIQSDTEGAISLWLKYIPQTSSNRVVSFSDSGDAYSDFDIYTATTGRVILNIAEAGSAQLYVYTNTTYHDSDWHYIVVAVDSSGNAIYVDGNQITSLTYVNGDSSTQKWFNSVNDIDKGSIGRRDWASPTLLYFDGLIDEVRISSSARSAAWIAACYNNQGSPGTYQTETGSTTGGQKAGGTSATTLRNAVIRNAVIR